MAHIGCGIDVGGSGVKGALVDLDKGEFIGSRVRIDTPKEWEYYLQDGILPYVLRQIAGR